MCVVRLKILLVTQVKKRIELAAVVSFRSMRKETLTGPLAKIFRGANHLFMDVHRRHRDKVFFALRPT